jgi:serine/threonine protein phosphatase PrpC
MGDPKKAAVEVSNKALNHGSTDNITVIVLDLQECTKGLRRERIEIIRIVDCGESNG